MDKFLRFGRDVLKALLIGLAVAGVLALLVFLVALPCCGLRLADALEVMRNACCFFTGLLLLVLAGMMIIKGKKPEELNDRDGWKKHFPEVGVKTVLACFCAAFVIMVTIVDWLTRII